jgi:hypothetical protein
VRLLYLVGISVGGAVGWWAGSYEGIWTAFIASTVGSIVAFYAVYRLTRDYV